MKLLTWNTQWCCGLDGQVSPRRIVAHARTLVDFDVLCLQEIADNYPGLQGRAADDQPQVIAGLLPGFQVFFGTAVDEWGADGRSRFGNLIATRLPVLQVQHHPLPYPADPGVPSMPRMCTVVTLQDPLLGPVRVMTTHLEFYSRVQRMAQARALRALHAQACEQAAAPPAAAADDGESPFRRKTHTAQAILCGDFNLQASEAEYAELTADGPAQFHDAWHLLHGTAPQPPTFRLFDRRYGPEAIACDFVLLATALKDRVVAMTVDGKVQASDHQPVVVELR
jgi:endonuclease/exonuclease/phosphatase family metal-dependent hydrolase